MTERREYEWIFPEQGDDPLEQDPHNNEFFSRDQKKDEAIVREFIQNALDAKRNGEKNVHVRLAFGKISTSKFVGEYINKLIEHIRECGKNPLTSGSHYIRYFTLEDFGTIGLTGAINRGDGDVDRSHFFNFWRREGISKKAGSKGGRFGLGKTTFTFCSDLNSFWGLTCRSDDKKKILLGRSDLKHHTLNGKIHKYYGFYQGENNIPITEEDCLDKFEKDFQLKRKNKPGFSVVIPLPGEEIDYDSVTRSVVMHFFFPILRGDLVVEIEDVEKNKSLTMDKSRIRDIALTQKWENTDWESRNIAEIFDFAEDAVIYLTNGQGIKLHTNVAEIHKIDEKSFGKDFESAKNDFNNGKFVGFKIPVSIKSTVSYLPSGSSHFHVFLKKYPGQYDMISDEFYIRSGISIIKQKTVLGRRPVRGMVIAEEDIVSAFLNNAENPAHIVWNENEPGFKEKYLKAPTQLRFIANSVRDIASLLARKEEKIDKDILANIFFLPETEEEGDEDLQKGKKKVAPPEPPVEPKKSIFTVSEVEGGFSVHFIEGKKALPVKAKIKVAYDIHAGNPFTKYRNFDFDFSESSMSIVANGCIIEKSQKNEIEFTVKEEGGSVKVTGFDPNRDVIVDVNEEATE